MKTRHLALPAAVGVIATACVVRTNPPATSNQQPASAAPAATPAPTAAAAPPPTQIGELPADPNDPAPVAEALPEQQLVEPLPPPRSTPERLIAGAAEGRPERINPKAQAAYWIWRSPRAFGKFGRPPAEPCVSFVVT